MKEFLDRDYIQHTRPGGVHRDIPDGLTDDIENSVKNLPHILMILKN